MKVLLLPLCSLALLGAPAFAQTTVTKTTRTKTVVEPRASTNLYRAVPRETTDASAGKRMRMLIFKPTQFYYTRDSVIAYRYSAETTYTGFPEENNYYGPHGAAFIPESSQLPASATVRGFASVTRRTQPGVGMVPATPVAAPKKKVTATSSITPVATAAR